MTSTYLVGFGAVDDAGNEGFSEGALGRTASDKEELGREKNEGVNMTRPK